MPKKHVRGKTRRSRGGSDIIHEWTTGSVPSGSTVDVARSNFQSIPSNRNFRIERLVLETAAIGAVPGTPPTTGVIPIYSSAVVGELHINNAVGGTISASSGPFVVGSTVRRITLRNPPSQDYYPATTAPTSVIAAVVALCNYNPTNSLGSALIWVLHTTIRLQPEDLIASCPTIGLLPSDNPLAPEVDLSNFHIV